MNTKPFHRSIVDALRACKSREELLALGKLISKTTIQKNHLKILELLKKKGEEFGLTDKVLENRILEGIPLILISDIDMSVRLYNCLRGYLAKPGENFSELRLKDLLEYPESHFMKFRNFGKKMLVELREVVGRYGYKLKK